MRCSCFCKTFNHTNIFLFFCTKSTLSWLLPFHQHCHPKAALWSYPQLRTYIQLSVIVLCSAAKSCFCSHWPPAHVRIFFIGDNICVCNHFPGILHSSFFFFFSTGFSAYLFWACFRSFFHLCINSRSMESLSPYPSVDMNCSWIYFLFLLNAIVFKDMDGSLCNIVTFVLSSLMTQMVKNMQETGVHPQVRKNP